MTEHNIFHEIEADLEQQKYEELWKRYGPWIIAAAVLAVLATSGISWWRSWHTARNQQASVALFSIMEKAEDNPGAARQEMGELETFAASNSGVAHQTLARLDAAGLAAKAGDTKQAIKLYDEIAGDSAVEPVFQQFATLMSVRAQMDAGDPAQLEKRLDPLLTAEAPWHYKAMEYGGFLALRAGDKEKARQIFAELSQDARVPETLSARAADMLHYLSE